MRLFEFAPALDLSPYISKPLLERTLTMGPLDSSRCVGKHVDDDDDHDDDKTISHEVDTRRMKWHACSG